MPDLLRRGAFYESLVGSLQTKRNTCVQLAKPQVGAALLDDPERLLPNVLAKAGADAVTVERAVPCALAKLPTQAPPP